MQEVDVSIETTTKAAAEDVVAVLELAQGAARTDKVAPLSEQTRLELRHGAPAVREVLLRADGELVGYGHVDLSDPVDGPSGELVVAPHVRGRGYGRRLVETLLEEAGHHDTQGRLRVWGHGKLPPAERLASSLGFEAFRELWQMRRSTSAPVPEIVPPAGVTLRTFTPGRDEAAWLALNAKSFAHHPEQGGWTLDDLKRRMAEPWFDPAGFFLAEKEGKLVGFHWTKTHPPTEREGLLGEVYVVGVDPAEQGGGLGRVLTAVGLRHLADLHQDGQTPTEVLLYVDADNTAAVRVYERLGFRVHTVDVMYKRG